MQRELIELEHDQYINKKVNQEMNAIIELVERKDKDNKEKNKTAWEAQHQMKKDLEEVERLF